MGRVVRFALVAGACILAMLAGWLLSYKMGLVWQNIAGMVTVAILLLFLVHSQESWRQRFGATMGTLWLLGIVVTMGAFVEESDVLGWNKWISRSASTINQAVFPVQTFSGSEARVSIGEEAKDALSRSLTNFTWHPNDTRLGRMLVSFSIGLATVDGGNIRFLQQGPVVLPINTPLPDNSFFAFTPGGANLTRLRLVGNDMIKLWTNQATGLNLHHWGDVADGKFYIGGKTMVNLPNSLSQRIGHRYAECTFEQSGSDVVHVFDVDTGKLLETIDVLAAIASMPPEGDGIRATIKTCGDPLDLNDVQVLKTTMQAGYFPEGKVGDILVSLRRVNAVLLLDHESHEVKWFVTEGFQSSYAPRVTTHGSILLFDNLGSDAAHGRSRIVEIDIASRRTIGHWEATEGAAFDASRRGKIILLGEDILVMDQESVRGHDNTLFLLDCPQKPITTDCVRVPIFTGKPPQYQYDNILLMEKK